MLEGTFINAGGLLEVPHDRAVRPCLTFVGMVSVVLRRQSGTGKMQRIGNVNVARGGKSSSLAGWLKSLWRAVADRIK
jgi:hypothetical protein